MQDKCIADDADRVQYNLTLSPWQQHNFSCVCVLPVACCTLRVASFRVQCRNLKLVRKRLQPTSAVASQLLWSLFDLHRTVNCGRYLWLQLWVAGDLRIGLMPHNWFAPVCICIAHTQATGGRCRERGTGMGDSLASRISIYSQLV